MNYGTAHYELRKISNGSYKVRKARKLLSYYEKQVSTVLKYLEKLEDPEAPTTKLTAADVRNIRKKYSLGSYTFKDLGERYGVASNTISDIVKFRTWKHLR